MMHLCLILVSISPGALDDPTTYGGATLQQWQTRLGHFDPADEGNVPAVPALIAIIDDDDLPCDDGRTGEG